MVDIKGLQKTSLIDYPGKICCVIFLPSCNFRCPFCQNPDLILVPDRIPTTTEEEFFDFLQKRKKWLDGICITGGEPCIHNELPDFIEKIKELGFLVKLDTNGSNPEMIKQLLDKKLLDYIAMDIKTSLDIYEKATKVRTDMEKVKNSIELIRKSGIDHEFRATAVPGIFDKNDAEAVGRFLWGSKNFYLQQFRPQNTLDRKYEKVRPYSKEELEKLAKILGKYIKNVEIRD